MGKDQKKNSEKASFWVKGNTHTHGFTPSAMANPMTAYKLGVVYGC